MAAQVDHTLVHLKIIARIPAGARLSIHGDNITIDTPSSMPLGWVLEGLARRWNGDSRERSVEALHQVFVGAMELTSLVEASHASHAKDKSSLLLLLDAMEQALQGVANVQETYISDPHINAFLDVLKQKVQMYVDQCRARNP